MAVISKTDLENAKLDADDLASFVSDVAGTVTPRYGGTYPNIRQLVDNFDDVLAEQVIEEETATAQAVIATTQAGIATSAAADLAGSLPRAGSTLKQAKRIGWLYANVSNRAVLQSDGRWKTTANALDATWRYVLTAADIANGQATVFWNVETAGIAYTVEEIGGAGVAPATVTVAGSYAARTWTLNAATTELRLRATKASGTTYVGAPSVTIGQPVTAPSDPDYYAVLGDYLASKNDGALLSYLAPAQTSVVIPVGPHTATMPINVTTVYIYYALKAPISGDITVLVEIASTNLAPTQLQVTPIGDQGTLGANIDVLQTRFNGSNSRFIVTLPHKTAGEVVVGFRVFPYTLGGGGPNVGTADALTVTARAYNSTALPALRSVPSVVTQAITDQATATLAAAEVARTNAIEDAYKVNVFRNPTSAQINYRLWLNQMAQYFASSVSGVDANSGATAPLAKKLIQSVITAGITPGRSVLLARNERHYMGFSPTQFPASDPFMGSYGRSEKRAVMDSRKDLSGLTWTNVSGTVWQTDVVLDQATTMFGAAAETSSHLRVWDCRSDPIGTQYETIWTGATQGDNITIVTATPGTTTIYKTGSSLPDPRVNASEQGTNYHIVMNAIDGVNPNGKAFAITQRGGPAFVAGGSLTDMVIIGACGKDGNDVTPSTVTGAFTEVGNCRFIYSVCHGNVGPITTTGSNWFISQYRPLKVGEAKTTASILNRSIAGGGLHVFAPGNYQDRDLTILHTQYVVGMTNGFYGHISSNPGGYRNGYVEHLVAANCTNALSYDSSVASPLFTGTFTVGRLDNGPLIDPETNISYNGCDNAMSVSWASTVRILSGQHIGSTLILSGAGSFMTVRAATTYHVGENGGFYYQARHDINKVGGIVVDGVTFNNNSANYLLQRSGPTAEGTPVIHLYGVVDATPMTNSPCKATISAVAGGGGNANAYDFELNLHSAVKDRYGNASTAVPCILGSLFPIAANAHFPTRLFVDSGQTFGFGNRSRAQIIAAYLANGKVQGTLANPRLAVDGITAADFYIHPETWIVDVRNTIIDWPQSIKDAILAV